MPYLKELARQNVLDLVKLIEWNAEQYVKLSHRRFHRARAPSLTRSFPSPSSSRSRSQPHLLHAQWVSALELQPWLFPC